MSRTLLRRLRLPLAVVVVCAVGLGLWLGTSGGPGYPTGTFRMATGSQSGVYALYGTLLDSAVHSELPGVDLKLDPTAGGPDNLSRIISGQDDFGIATADAVSNYSGPGKSQLRALGELYDDYVQLVVPTDSPIRSVAQLRGHRVGTGQADSGVELIARRVLTVTGLTPGRDLTAVPLGIEDAPAALEAHRIDAFFWSGGLPTGGVTQLMRQDHVRLVPLGGLAAQMDQLAQKQDGGTDDIQIYRTSTIPASAYPGSLPDKPVSTLAVANLMVTRADVPDALVERMTEVIMNSRDSIGQQVHAAQLVDIRSAIYTDPLPLAEGARRYYVSVKP
ncbi:TAXI family TRAP transporter solute-binding subunit [Streptacidiphilus fuscans]|uniref:TAXI family TRAP transporter solute-binding subunit n=1 Tax=Streptacidiphilus fuscans TaxID=2789292 RepID=A0A931BDT2_9ACTN|nr:TAXI family TRAP transporter solute-binding subunit [Streptacidiphilus fuscans]MBF9073786.1 TAXI family TRAP transporter solute-binding subunit [Streptacidiphilus fuscans]